MGFTYGYRLDEPIARTERRNPFFLARQQHEDAIALVESDAEVP